MLRFIPLFAVMLVVYNLLLLSGNINATLGNTLFEMSLISGAQWRMTTSDLLLMFGVITLYIEIFKSTRTGMASVLDHTLSTLVFVAFLVEFLTVAGCGTSTFFILGLMAMFDVIAGFTVSIVAARRDMSFGTGVDL